MKAALALALACCAGLAAAEVRTAQRFDWDGGLPDDVRSGRVFSAWNARNAPGGLAPGLKVMFFGGAEACARDAVNGPTVATGNPRLLNSINLTGVPHDAARGRSWTPSGDHAQCDSAARGQAGDSFVHLNPDPSRGGVALFTYTGRRADGSPAFFQPFGTTGQVGSGANAHISGTFFAFRFDGLGPARIAPWSGAGGAADPVIELSSVQSVPRAEVPGGKSPAPEDVAQAKQQMIFTLINRACWRAPGKPAERLCQMQYLLNLAVVRTGVTDWRTVTWFRDAGIDFDPAQNGVPVVHGPIPGSGGVARDAVSGLPLYTSGGAATQHAPFKDQRFAVRVGFGQLQNAMRVVVGRRLGKAPQALTSAEVAAEFGPGWDDPAEWALLSVNIGQEVYNRSRERRAFIGGSFRTLSIGPLPARS